MKYRWVHIALASLVYFSSLGVLFNKHYCQEELKGFAFFLEAENCHERAARAEMPPNCPMHGSDSPESDHEKDCCEEESQYLKLELEHFSPDRSGISADIDHFVAGDVGYSSPICHSSTPVEYLNYRPPLLFFDLAVLQQVFLL